MIISLDIIPRKKSHWSRKLNNKEQEWKTSYAKDRAHKNEYRIFKPVEITIKREQLKFEYKTYQL
jgi:hypothetical protein